MPSKRQMAVMEELQKHIGRDKLASTLDPRGFIRMFVYGGDVYHHCILDYKAELDAVTCVIVDYITSSEAKEVEILKAFMHAQKRACGLRFFQDFDDGHIFADSHIFLHGALPTYGQFKCAFRGLLSAASDLYPAFQRILWIPSMTAEESFRIFDVEKSARDTFSDRNVTNSAPTNRTIRFLPLDGAEGN